MSHAAQRQTPDWLASAVAWLTPRRLRAQGVILAVCLWGVCAVDFATPGFFDRAGNLKFQDFLPFYVSARLIAQGRTDTLYNQQVTAEEFDAILHRSRGEPADGRQPTVPLSASPSAGPSSNVRLPILYGPQVGLIFVPLSRLSFPAAARIWIASSLFVFFACIYLVWRVCPALSPHWKIVAIAAVAFPPLFHFFVRGQISVLLLVCFTAAFLAFRADRDWLAGVALGLLVFKPQFLVAIPLILLLARSWKPLAALSASAAVQLAATWLYFGFAVMRAYVGTLWHISRWINAAELRLAPIQMHSLRSFWSLLIPWPNISLALYLLSCIVIIAMAAVVWKSASPPALRFSALLLAAVLANPHLFVYDLLVLAPALLLLVDWTLAKTNPRHHDSAALQLLSYSAYILPLFGPLSRWTHVQLSVPVFVALLWILCRHSADVPSPAADAKLASPEARIV
ncbi:MAG: glycosyltransferase family 87 protein [Candidatus Sulfotelmatobacter sp.]